MFRQDDLSQFFLGNSGPLKRQTEQRTQYFRDYEKSKRSRRAKWAPTKLILGHLRIEIKNLVVVVKGFR
jgi:hypothetical protein